MRLLKTKMAYKQFIREFAKITKDNIYRFGNKYNESNNFGKYLLITKTTGAVGGVGIALGSEVYNDNVIKKTVRCGVTGVLGYFAGPIIVPFALLVYSYD